MKKRYQVGYTTGVFDLFHVGHLNILRVAKEQCEHLIVGVSTDELTQAYKNKYPIISQEERRAIVEAIRFVDEVIWQDNLDKVLAWEKLHFNVLFHGDDWKNSELYRNIEKELSQRGVSVEYIPHTSGVSSTMLADKLSHIDP